MKVTLPNDEKLSSVTLKLSGVHDKYIIDLLNEQIALHGDTKA